LKKNCYLDNNQSIICIGFYMYGIYYTNIDTIKIHCCMFIFLFFWVNLSNIICIDTKYLYYTIGKKVLVFQVCYANYNNIKHMSYVDSTILHNDLSTLYIHLF